MLDHIKYSTDSSFFNNKPNGEARIFKSQKYEPAVQKCIDDFCKPVKSQAHLEDLVKKHNKIQVPLECPEGVYLRITAQDGTIYWGRKDMLDSWQELYLPDSEKMVVIGAVDNMHSLAEGLQLVIMVDRKGNVYAYENHVLHHMARSVQTFFKKGASFPPIKSYMYGEYTKPETEEEYLQILKDEGIPKINEHTRKFVENSGKDMTELLDFLDNL
ncbi:uncharacterized protein LOC136749910 [Amia ocellicauda]|uniref:uncharacterized protein LOC136749910 n=1 Tax=Amia ocellicauda TaxID=2972642 RepID=UPI003463E776